MFKVPYLNLIYTHMTVVHKRSRCESEGPFIGLSGVQFPPPSPKWNFPWELQTSHIHLALSKWLEGSGEVWRPSGGG